MTIDDVIAQHVGYFRELTQDALEDMFACGTKVTTDEAEQASKKYLTEMPFSVRIQFTGIGKEILTTGEYIIATDERVAAASCAITSPDATSSQVESVREEYSNAFSEFLNSVVGQAVIQLEELGILKFGTPRVSYGKMSYGRLQIRRSALATSAGRIECLFLL